ncbi:MAG: family transcriptional regulator [Candidatus Krumholzibacteriota bacterium]|jgi:redox-sensing transcriptional repressor|nr:family transcriptional regulator [Candidatus Krumholzibacteriota bacterium]
MKLKSPLDDEKPRERPGIDPALADDREVALETDSALAERVSEFTVRRMSTYYRILLSLERHGVETVSSARLAELCAVTSAQVRKDLSYFGSFGTRGLGYQVSDLKGAIVGILGLNRKWSMVLFGAGSLGHALFFYQGFRDDGFYFTHVFDADPERIGERWNEVEIRPVLEARKTLEANRADIGVVATPEEAAQEIADLLVELGVKGILNFAPKHLTVPANVRLRNVNLAVALESLSFMLSK